MSKLEINKPDIDFFNEKGYLVLHDLIDKKTILSYQNIYDDFISGAIDVGSNRRDLKGEDGISKTESISQIMINYERERGFDHTGENKVRNNG